MSIALAARPRLPAARLDEEVALPMVWFRVDDKLHDHPKIRRLRTDKLAALGLWTACGAWSADTLSDGFVPGEIVRRFDPEELHAKRLVEVGLWVDEVIDDEHGYRFHEWSEHQPSRAKVLKERADAKARVANWRERKRNAVGNSVRNALPDELPGQGAEADGDALPGNATGNGVRTPSVTPPPTRPDPTRPRDTREAAQKRGTRLPEDWQPDPDLIAWARATVPRVDGRRETEKFRNYWHAKAGRDAVKIDWPKTWRNWLLSADERLPAQAEDPARTGKRRLG